MLFPGAQPAGGPGGQKRSNLRKAMKHAAVLHYNGTQIPVVLHDMSRGGVRIGLNSSRAATTFDGPAILEVAGAVRLPVNIRWQKDAVFGAAFDLPAARKVSLQQQIDRIIARATR